MSLRIRFRPIRTRVVSKLLYKNLYHFVGHCGTFYDLKWTINALNCISAAEINITMQASNQNREAVGVCWRFLTASVKKKNILQTIVLPFSMPSEVIIILVQFMFFVISISWAPLRAHFNPRLTAGAKMSLCRA